MPQLNMQAQEKLPIIAGDSMVCGNFYYTYSVKNKPLDYDFEWKAYGGKIDGDKYADSVTVLWDLKGKRSIKLYIKNYGKRGIVYDSLKMNIKDIVLKARIKGDKNVVSDTRTSYSLAILNGVKPDYIEWQTTDNQFGCIAGQADTNQIEVQWYNSPNTAKTYLMCKVGKCVNTYNLAVPVTIKNSSAIKRIDSHLQGNMYVFKAFTKGNIAAKYIWDFNDGFMDTTTENTISHRFFNVSDSIHHIYVRSIDKTNKIVSKVFDYRFKINIDSSSYHDVDTLPLLINARILCNGANNGYLLKLYTYSTNIRWDIKGKSYYRKELVLSANAADTFNIALYGKNTRITKQIVLPNLPKADFELEKEKDDYRFCEGESFHLVNMSSGSIDNYKWDFFDNTYSFAQNPYKTYSSDYVFFYELYFTVVDKYDCRDTIHKTIRVFNNTFSIIQSSFNPETVDVYSDSTITRVNIKPVFYGGYPPFDYQWRMEDRILMNHNKKTLDYVESKNTYYILKITDSKGCYKYMRQPPVRTKLIIRK